MSGNHRLSQCTTSVLAHPNSAGYSPACHRHADHHGPADIDAHPPSPDFYAGTDTDAVFPNRDTLGHRYRNADADRNTNTDAHQHSGSNAHAYPHTNPNVNSGAGHCHLHANAHRDIDANQYTNADANR
ncbi:MAG: hypothetical protein Kow0063_23050 [Anaerolineae bacterium]